jgi:16S rRNA (guanine(966)-N(2))-methyltransferase RsmD
MIITSGIYRGIPLSAPKSMKTRPTLGKTRQAIFNMIRPYLDGAVVMDFFSGTGAMGFEALSNGAAKAYLIDSDTAPVIRKNAEKLKVNSASYAIMAMDFRKAAQAAAGKGIKAAIIFADPPYNNGFIKMLLQMIKISDILNKDGLVVLELHGDERETLKEEMKLWNILKDKQYGDTYVVCLKKAED